MNARSVLQTKRDWPEAALQLAWLLATCPEEEERDGQEAVHYARLAERTAEEAMSTAAGKQRYRRLRPRITDTLAAAYAEAGDFETAQDLAQQAYKQYLDLQRNEEADRAHERLKMYRRHETYRDVRSGKN